MRPKLILNLGIQPILILLVMTNGCDDRVTQVAREAADRQAQQNTAMANLNQEVAAGTRQGSRSAPLDMPLRVWTRCTELVRQSRRAELRNWRLAAAQLRDDLDYELTTLRAEVNALSSQLTRVPLVKSHATVGNIYQDLVALAEEFEQLDFDIRGHRLSITTAPITLENLYLGPFEIRLRWGRQTGEPSYRVVAVDPHPAASRDNVTHPHVMDEQLCEGESHVAIRQALSQGRLLDFFTLVVCGLRSYNADSPFVSIESWFGGRCADCGYGMDEEEGYTCDKCQASICNECNATCNGCEANCCSECVTTCEGCDDSYCRSCLSPCLECHRHFCSHCLLENERCSNCHEQELQAEPAEASPEIQPDRLGQAAVPAGCG